MYTVYSQGCIYNSCQCPNIHVKCLSLWSLTVVISTHMYIHISKVNNGLEPFCPRPNWGRVKVEMEGVKPIVIYIVHAPLPNNQRRLSAFSVMSGIASGALNKPFIWGVVSIPNNQQTSSWHSRIGNSFLYLSYPLRHRWNLIASFTTCSTALKCAWLW